MPEGKATIQSVVSRRQMLSRSLAVAGLSMAAIATGWTIASVSGQERPVPPTARRPCPTPAARTRETVSVPETSERATIEHLGPVKRSLFSANANAEELSHLGPVKVKK